MRWTIEYSTKTIRTGKVPEFEGGIDVVLQHIEELFGKFKISQINLRRTN